MLDHNALKQILPQAYPFLMLDRVVEYTAGQSLTAIKNITADEWFFQESQDDQNNTNHFPETLLIEAAAQAALVLYHVSKVKAASQSRLKYFIGRIRSEFFKPIEIGEQLQIEVKSGKIMDSGGYTDVQLSSNSFQVAQMELIFKVQPR